MNDADFLICFGGDGTILHAARDANLRGIPILGINMGSVGFMAELEHSELHHLAKLAAGDYSIETRMMLDVRVYRDDKEIAKDVALNDAVITKGAVARIVSRSVARDASVQVFHPRALGHSACKAHIQCDSIIMDGAQVSSIPEIGAYHVDAQIVHEAAIGRINNDQLIKLMSFGLTEEEAEAVIVDTFLQ